MKSETLVGVVFVTNATNSGLLNGVVVRLQRLLVGRWVFATRLSWSHFGVGVWGKLFTCLSREGKWSTEKQRYWPTKKGKGTQSPEDPLFKEFSASWKHVDKSDYKVCNDESREQAVMMNLVSVTNFTIFYPKNVNFKKSFCLPHRPPNNNSQTKNRDDSSRNAACSAKTLRC